MSIEPRDWETYLRVREEVTELVGPFYWSARDVFNARRAQMDPMNRMGTPFLHDDLVPETWRLSDDGTMIIVATGWDEDSAEFPVELVTQDLEGTDWADSVWAEWVAKGVERKREKRERDLAELKRLAERYPDEVSKL